MKINVYEQLNKPQVLNTIEVKEWFDLIRNSDYTPQITLARANSKDLKDLKEHLPCVTYNFLYNGYKKDANIIAPTGIIFLDIDKPDFDISILKGSGVLGYYKSLGGLGYHVLLKMDGLNPVNFKESYRNICYELGLLEYIDPNAIKLSQFSVLSFDADAYLNDNPHVYMAVSSSSVISKEDDVSPSNVISTSIYNDVFNIESCIPIGGNIKKKTTYTLDGDTKIRFNNLDEIDIPQHERYILDWEGYEYVRCWIPIHKLKDGRKRFLLSYTTNFIWLNPNLDYEKYLLIFGNVNQIAFHIPLPSDRIQNTLNTVIKQLKEEKLQPINYRYKRKILFNPLIKFDNGEKMEIVLQELAINRTNQSLGKMRAIIENWDGKLGRITARNIHDASQKNLLAFKVSYKTICKYMKNFKTEIAQKNEEISDSPDCLLDSRKPFDFLLGGTYQFGIDILGWKSYYPQIEFKIDAKHFAGVHVENLKRRLLSIDLNDSAGRKELYDFVQMICKMDSDIDFDTLYMEMFKLYRYRKLSA